MRILIADDEAPARERLQRLLSECEGGHQVVGEAADGREAVAACEHLYADLVLLDISMPGMDGLEAAERLARLEPPPAVILVTAYTEHALDAFERRVEDYLVKPVRRERLQAALDRLCVATRPQRQALLEMGRDGSKRSHLSAYYRGDLQTVPLEEVVYLQAEHKYVVVHHDDGNLLLDESLKSLEEEFPELFIRIHRNALVARRHVSGLEKGEDGAALVRLRGCDERLLVSRRHLPEIRRWLRSGMAGRHPGLVPND